MIIVTYVFFNKQADQWRAGENTFHDPYKARRFVFAIRRKGAKGINVECSDYEDYELLDPVVYGRR